MTMTDLRTRPGLPHDGGHGRPRLRPRLDGVHQAARRSASRRASASAACRRPGVGAGWPASSASRWCRWKRRCRSTSPWTAPTRSTDDLDLIKGYGRALVREKIVAAASRKFVILVGPGKRRPACSASRASCRSRWCRSALPLAARRLQRARLRPGAVEEDGKPFVTDNGNHILDCGIPPTPHRATRRRSDASIRAIPGVVGTGLFLGMADVVLVGDDKFNLVEERERRVVARERR